MKSRSKLNNGFVLLYAVLVSSIVLTVGLLLANILLKQLVIAGAARDAKIAYYAADAGRDCALYWVNELGSLLFAGGITSITCNGEEEDGGVVVGGLSTELDRGDHFEYDVNLPGEGSMPIRCAHVEVYHGVPADPDDPQPDDPQVLATIRSYGYNNECDSTSPRLIQRFIETRVIQ